ncbi:MAG: enoyl-CoA hydratase [Ketobacteraceae bacterium]|nr:enoyl-CoA hydratase [Ketobacteraceae bacterium]
MSASENIRTRLDDGILSIEIHRPDKKNALTQDMYTALCDALEQLDSSNDARVGFITGTPDCFTAGNDLADFLNSPPSADNEPPVFRFLKTLPRVQKPLVAAVNGPAIGIGTTLLLHCDLVYAARDAKLQLPFASLGACPEAGSALLLPQTMGYQKAAELLMLCDFFSGEQGKELGLINEVFDSGDYRDKAYEQARRISLQPASSMRVTKMLLKKSSEKALAEIMEIEMDYFARMLRSPEAKEAISAFMEKRKPDFTQFN